MDPTTEKLTASGGFTGKSFRGRSPL